MTTLVILLGLLVLAVVGLGWGLWQMSPGAHSSPQEAPPELVPSAPVRSYSPMARLFAGRDLTFLKTQPGYQRGMASQLRLARREVLSLYLGQVHREFRRSWAYCRAHAARSDSAELAPAAVKQFFVFYALYAALRAQCLLSLFVYVPMDVSGLLAVLQPLQQRVSQAAGHEPHGWTGFAAGGH